MQSPIAAARPWPTCSGPVGFAETNSTPALLAARRSCRGRSAAPRSRIDATSCRYAAGLRKKLMKPGPGDLDLRDRIVRRQRARRSPAASSRGLRRAAFASSMRDVASRNRRARGSWCARRRTRAHRPPAACRRPSSLARASRMESRRSSFTAGSQLKQSHSSRTVRRVLEMPGQRHDLCLLRQGLPRFAFLVTFVWASKRK